MVQGQVGLEEEAKEEEEEEEAEEVERVKEDALAMTFTVVQVPDQSTSELCVTLRVV